ncbi:hypothetical protein [Stenoxybacter acetivorans]|uniref:hypothetical protein n=1 Tax=Stenoxybacter acetivorans TaxID=422441 RepID=UPI0012EC7F79|nr:hypothetical protein [Stenoxybacter acetivorans]
MPNSFNSINGYGLPFVSGSLKNRMPNYNAFGCLKRKVSYFLILYLAAFKLDHKGKGVVRRVVWAR